MWGPWYQVLLSVVRFMDLIKELSIEVRAAFGTYRPKTWRIGGSPTWSQTTGSPTDSGARTGNRARTGGPDRCLG